MSMTMLTTARPHLDANKGSSALRIVLGAVVVVTVLAAPQAAAPASVAAASCTGWISQTIPPPTIKVLRTDRGEVQTVDFRSYVAEVMASGEWPTRLASATLEAGAVATKQYAWYYTLKGNHRAAYMRNGECYDVRDDTTDQLFRPERSDPTRKQERAVGSTWRLSLRKRDRFFLTGYRAGNIDKCGADANGWKLFALSVEACARAGWSRERIQDRYYSPDLSYVWAAHLGPPLRKPNVILKAGTTVAAGAATITWRPHSDQSDVASYRLQRKIGAHPWRNVALHGPKARRAIVKVGLEKTNRFRVAARDSRGRRGPWAYSHERVAAIRGPVGTTLGGSTVDPTSSDGIVRIAFSGHAIAYVAPNAPGFGKAKVLLGGKLVATVNLGKTPTVDRKLVWARNFARAKKRVVTVKPLDPAVRVDFDGFFILR